MKIILILLLTLCLSSCATGYQKMGAMGGYSEQQLNKDTFIVTYRGNGYTDSSRLQALILRRCADLTLSNGYSYFVILKGGQSSRQQVIRTPARIVSYGNGMGTYNQMGNFGNLNYSDNYQTNIMPSQTYMINRLTDSVIIKMLTDSKGKKTANAFDANLLLQNTGEM